MQNFEDFISHNQDTLFAEAGKNTLCDKNGNAVISEKESWFNEDEWDENYKDDKVPENEIHYVAHVKLNVEEVCGYIEKVEELISYLEKARDLLKEIKDFELNP